MIFVLVSILIFAATAALVAAMLTQRREREALELKKRVGGDTRGGAAATGAVDLERDTRMSTLPFLDDFLKKVSAARRIELLLYQAGLGMKVATFLLAIAAAAMASYLVSFIIFVVVFQWVWNHTVPDVFGLKRITFLQAIGILLLASILTGGHRIVSNDITNIISLPKRTGAISVAPSLPA